MPDLAWTRDYAIPYTDAKQPSVHPKVHEQMNLTPRFMPMLQAAFPQRQWFWKDHGSFWSVARVAREFLGVPGRSWNLGASAWLDEDRYVTEEGCVPHFCPNHGLLWVDTAPESPAVIFAATNYVSSMPPDEKAHLWVFTSSMKLNKNFPRPFQNCIKRWFIENEVEGYKQEVLLVTIVSPDGQMEDITFKDLIGKATSAGATQ